MRKIAWLVVIIITNCVCQAQIPVSWKYVSKKVSDKTFEVHITATIQRGWHLYSQTQPADAIAVPTSIKFNVHPLIKLNGKPKETGTLEKYTERSLGIEQWQYSNKVEFVQTVTLKSNVKTTIKGNIEYQACTDEKCLPPKVVLFSVRLE
ncbi:MAG: hypothetical protein KF741_13090 [Ferruginibacter sp.]|nr:hypothetical protein [Bacteroidota bacterium]MBX2920172.1 hypothetical protein [Ferruginibacter sp.]